MAISVYSSTGCIRCEIVKAYLREIGTEYVEYDIQTPEGDAKFKTFYRENRKDIRRDKSGVFFPLVSDGEKLYQDAGTTLAWLVAGNALDGIIEPNNLGHGWTGGLNIHECPEESFDAFVTVMQRLKRGGLHTCVKTNGNNPVLLKRLITEGLIDKLHFHLVGSEDVYKRLLPELPSQDVENTMELVQRLSCIAVYTEVAPEINSEVSLLNYDDVSNGAKWLYKTTGSKKFRLVVKRGVEEVANAVNLFAYRTPCREWQHETEILKQRP